MVVNCSWCAQFYRSYQWSVFVFWVCMEFAMQNQCLQAKLFSKKRSWLQMLATLAACIVLQANTHLKKGTTQQIYRKWLKICFIIIDFSFKTLSRLNHVSHNKIIIISHIHLLLVRTMLGPIVFSLLPIVQSPTLLQLL